MNLIYHIVSATDWAEQEHLPDYSADSLQTEGFIHLSRQEQVNDTLNRYYRSVPDLLLLHVDADKLTHELKYEESTNKALFPHLYGPLNKNAIVKIDELN
ncbi:DUF952 domain-containing protein [Spirosoma sp. KNUC1025]|uniref:DUF952 domain-containing protein n=1 Tax=Spirosoma sp. KNUC1025 TaxID=2894082 RepID=UPI00386D4BFB|nr:DUF952 domain-containing protein [Spirosoma sp. KNUC1025]